MVLIMMERRIRRMKKGRRLKDAIRVGMFPHSTKRAPADYADVPADYADFASLIKEISFLNKPGLCTECADNADTFPLRH